jgi:glucose-1-phosphate adenylyltransferase
LTRTSSLRAAFTVAGIRQPLALADQFGVIEVDPNQSDKIGAWREKPTDAVGLADSPDEVLASMGNYVASTGPLVEALKRDAEDPNSRHDMGGDIVTAFVERGEAGVYDFLRNDVPGSTDRDRDYWRDVGTLDAYYEANQDIISISPVFNLYNDQWPVYTGYTGLPPAKFVHSEAGRVGQASDSLVSPGVIVSGATVTGSVLSPGVRCNSWSTVSESVLLDDVEIGRHAQVHRAILDKNVTVKERSRVGIDREQDLARGFTVTESGVTVVPKGAVIED